MCNLRLNVSNEIPVVFHNGSNYDNKDYQKKKSKDNLNIWKYWKVQNLFCLRRIKSYKTR